MNRGRNKLNTFLLWYVLNPWMNDVHDGARLQTASTGAFYFFFFHDVPFFLFVYRKVVNSMRLLFRLALKLTQSAEGKKKREGKKKGTSW